MIGEHLALQKAFHEPNPFRPDKRLQKRQDRHRSTLHSGVDAGRMRQDWQHIGTGRRARGCGHARGRNAGTVHSCPARYRTRSTRLHASRRRTAVSNGRAHRAVSGQACRAGIGRLDLPRPGHCGRCVDCAERWVEGRSAGRCRRAAILGPEHQVAHRIQARARPDGEEPAMDHRPGAGLLQRPGRRDECDPGHASARIACRSTKKHAQAARGDRIGAQQLHARPERPCLLRRTGRHRAAAAVHHHRARAARRGLRAELRPGSHLWRAGRGLPRVCLRAAGVRRTARSSLFEWADRRGGCGDFWPGCGGRLCAGAPRLGLELVGHELGTP